MRNELKPHGERHHGPLYLATIGALFGAGVAGAADTAPVVNHQNGAMTFPHVRVVNAPELATSSATAAGQAGLRAYIDPATGALRPPTQEELIAESLEAQKAAALKPQAAEQVSPRFDPQTGAFGAHLGESQMVFSVVQKRASGELTEFCVIGPEQATKMMNFNAPSRSALQRKGDRNDR